MKNLFYHVVTTVLFYIICVSVVYAQTTSIKLPTASDSSSNFRILDNSDNIRLRLNADGGFYIGGSHGTGYIPITGSGTRLMWFPRKSAFRAGRTNTQWDFANIGDYSLATGLNTTASGNSSIALGSSTTASNFAAVAMGHNSAASGYSAIAMGYHTEASGDYSTTMGHNSAAKGQYSIAMGDSCQANRHYSVAIGRSAVADGIGSVSMGAYTTASGDYSTAMGYYTTASGTASVAMGDPTVATGNTSIAIGHEVRATGDFSTALGSYASTNRMKGSFIIGDMSVDGKDSVYSSSENQISMRFDGGYRFFSVADLKIGVFLPHGANTWQQESDSTKKERFIYSNGEYFLESLAKIRLGSWNYKCQREKQYRHYGPMAQDIFSYFGKDEYGTIGNDTTLSSGDMDGIMMICLQALEKRTCELNLAQKKLAETINKLEQANDKIVMIEQQNIERDKIIGNLTKKIETLTNTLSASTTNINPQK